MRRGSTLHKPRNLFSRRPICAFAVLAIGAGCASVDTAVVADPGVAFALPLGKTATLSSNGTHITFNKVTDDSRCPIDVVCVWAGDAKIELAIARNGSPPETRVVSITPPNDEVVSGDLKVRLVGLAPAPRQAEPSASRAYVARLIVTPAG
jgi:hypothetical protein